MTNLEKAALDRLIEAWSAFLLLPTEHADDVSEFRHGIHALQQMIMARPMRRQINAAFQFQTKAGEDAEATTGAASIDPVSRANENRDRQQGSIVGTTDGRQHGGVEEPVAADRHAQIQPETATEAPKQVYGDSVDLATATPSQSVDIPAGGISSASIDGLSADAAELNSPEQASTGAVTGWVDPPSTQTGSRDLRDVILPLTSGETNVAVVGTERGTLVNSKPYVLRPHCKRPGSDDCGGYGASHCHSCTISTGEAA